jgi:O-acetyl-ADP-ribose deacetylase (regulator of RNase III)
MKAIDERICVIQGDITRLDVDAIVNAANSTLLGGGGVDGAIHRAAGPQLREHCSSLGGCPTGEARITPGFRLPARYVIHTVGPVWHGGGHGEAALLESCYRSVFSLALQHEIASLAVPAISCGAYGFPKEEAARIAVSCCAEAIDTNTALRRVMLCAFDAEMARLYRDLLFSREREPRPSESPREHLHKQNNEANTPTRRPR